jgi:hypothetical protein
MTVMILDRVSREADAGRAAGMLSPTWRLSAA